MRLTKREQTLSILMLFVVAAYFLFQYIITPQLAGLSDIKSDMAQWEEKKQKLAVMDDTVNRLTFQKDQMEIELQTISNRYFACLNTQEETIIVLNDLISNTGLKDVSISFDQLTDAVIAGTETGATTANNASSSAPLVQVVMLNYEGSYTAVWDALRNFWGFNKFIQVNSVNMSLDPSNAELLTGTIELSLYDLSQMTQINNTMVEWAENGTFRKSNPFLAVTDEQFPGTRYVLNLDGSSTYHYVKFVDISGNWAESAIDDFGMRHLITGDSENRFFPDEQITRGDLVVLLDKYFKWEIPEDKVDLTQFSDYGELGQSLSAMEAAFYKGYVLGCLVGYDDGTLRPNAPTSYKEFELVMSRSLNQPDFKWKDTALEMEKETGFTSPGLSNEAASITRGEVVYFLHSLPQA